VLGGRVALLEKDERPYILKGDAFVMEVYYKVGLTGPTISQGPGDLEDIDDFTGSFLYKVALRHYGEHNKPKKLPDEFFNGLETGAIVVSFETPAGKQKFEISEKSKYRVYIMPYDDLLLHPGYQQLKNNILKKSFRLLPKADGTNAIAIVSYEGVLTELEDKFFMKMTLYPLAAMMDPRQKPDLYTNPPNAYPSGETDYYRPSSLKHFKLTR